MTKTMCDEGVLDVAVRPKYLRDALAVMGSDDMILGRAIA